MRHIYSRKSKALHTVTTNADQIKLVDDQYMALYTRRSISYIMIH